MNFGYLKLEESKTSKNKKPLVINFSRGFLFK